MKSPRKPPTKRSDATLRVFKTAPFGELSTPKREGLHLYTQLYIPTLNTKGDAPTLAHSPFVHSGAVELFYCDAARNRAGFIRHAQQVNTRWQVLHVQGQLCGFAHGQGQYGEAQGIK